MQPGPPDAPVAHSVALMSHTIERLRITVADVTYALGPVEHIGAVKAAILAGVHAGGGFVDLILDNGRLLSLLVTESSHIAITVDTLRLDSGTADGEFSGDERPRVSVDYDADTPFDTI